MFVRQPDGNAKWAFRIYVLGDCTSNKDLEVQLKVVDTESPILENLQNEKNIACTL